jgi:hypothetical protein
MQAADRDHQRHEQQQAQTRRSGVIVLLCRDTPSLSQLMESPDTPVFQE